MLEFAMETLIRADYVKRLKVRSLRRSFLNSPFLILSAFFWSCELLHLILFPNAGGAAPPITQSGVSPTQRSDDLVADHLDSFYTLQTLR